MSYILQTSKLTKRYKNFWALKGLSMHVPQGAIYGLVGKNGAGKTTLIRLICGLQKPTKGNYILYGIKNTDRKIVSSRRRMGAVVESPAIYMDMTAEDNLKQQCLILGVPGYDSIPEILELVGLKNTGNKKAKHFSLGMKQRLGIAVALVGNPDFLVLDEPINGYLDLLNREEKSEKVENYISQIKNRTEALKSLTEELFRYSVVTTMQELKSERLDMVRALEESLLSFYAVLQEKGIRPEIKLPEEPVWRDLDAGAVNRIFANIISNVVKYSDGDLSVVMDERGSVIFSNTAKSLSTVEVGRLFDRFYTVEASRSSTGLGLFIAKVLTERMGGSISAQYQNERLYVRVEFL